METIITSLEFFFPPEETEVPDTASTSADSVAAATSVATTTITTTASHESSTKQTTLVVSTPLTTAATTYDTRPSGLLGVPGVMLEDNSLQRRRSNINVLKQFFEEKAPPPASALRPTSDPTTTR